MNVFDDEAELLEQPEADRISFLARLGLSLDEYAAYVCRFFLAERQGVN